jgi:hypothetical protein
MSRPPYSRDSNPNDESIYGNEEDIDEWSSDGDFGDDEENYANLEQPAAAEQPPPRPLPLPPRAITESSVPLLPPRGPATVERSGSIQAALQAALVDRQKLLNSPASRTPLVPPVAQPPANVAVPRSQRSLPPIPPLLPNENSVDDGDVYEMPDEVPAVPPVATKINTMSRPLPPPPVEHAQNLSVGSDDDDYLEPDDVGPKLTDRPIPLPPLPEPPAANQDDSCAVYESGELYNKSEQDVPAPSAKVGQRPVIPSKLLHSPSDLVKKKELSCPQDVSRSKSGGKPQNTPWVQPNFKTSAKDPEVTAGGSGSKRPTAPFISGGVLKLDVPVVKPPGRKSPFQENSVQVSSELLDTKSQLKPVKMAEISTGEAGNMLKSSAKTEIISHVDPSPSNSGRSVPPCPKKSAKKEELQDVNRSCSPCPPSQDQKSMMPVAKQNGGGTLSKFANRENVPLPAVPPTVQLAEPRVEFMTAGAKGDCTAGSRAALRPPCHQPASDVVPSDEEEEPTVIPEPRNLPKASGGVRKTESFNRRKTSDKESEAAVSGNGFRRPSAPALSVASNGLAGTAKLDVRPLPPVPAAEGPLRLQPVQTAEVVVGGLQSYPWFVGELGRKEAEAKIRAFGQDGAFVVRTSQNGGARNPYALTLLYSNNPYHLHIRKRADNKFAIGNEKPDEIIFQTVQELVKFYQQNMIDLIGDSRRNIAAGRVLLKVCMAK